mgnify:CR=1 FL=1
MDVNGVKSLGELNIVVTCASCGADFGAEEMSAYIHIILVMPPSTSPSTTMSGEQRPHCGRASGEFSTITQTGRLPILLSERPVRPVSGFTSVAAGSDVVAGADVSVSKSFCFYRRQKACRPKAKHKSQPQKV